MRSARRFQSFAARGNWLALGALVAMVALVVLPGCNDLSQVLGNPQDRAKHTADAYEAEPFEIGPASRWQTPGLYLDFVNEHNVALKSGNGMLVAILLVAPDTGEIVHYDRLTNLFRDPQSGQTYTSDGLKWGGSEDRPSLPRCRIRHLGSLKDPDVPLLVDPNKLYRQEEMQWSKAASNHLFTKPAD